MKNVILFTMLFILCVSGHSIPAAPETQMDSETPPIEGDWNEDGKSLFLYSSSTIQIDITGSTLTISSKTLRSDITIHISQNDDLIFDQTVPASETKSITIDLSDFEAGDYLLELSNQWGNYLYGYFSIE